MASFRRIRIVTKRVIRETFKRYLKPLTVFLLIAFLLVAWIVSSNTKCTVKVYFYEDRHYRYDFYQVDLGRTLELRTLEKVGYEYAGLYYDNLYHEKFNKMTPIFKDTNLFIRYDSKEYVLTLDHDGGTGAQDTVKVLFNQPLPEPAPPQKQGFLFMGYFEPYEGKRIYSDTMKADTVWSIPQDTTVCARWVEAQNIVLDKQGGEGGADFVVGGLGTTLAEIDFPTKEGYKFSGYYSQPDGQGKRYYAYHERQVWDNSESQTLYAYWAKSLMFDKQGGSGGSDSVDAIKNKDLPSAIAPQKEGYTFDGYYFNPNGTGKQYYSKDMTPLSQWDLDDSYAITLYANWLVNYTVTLQNGSGQNASIIVNKDRDMPVIANNLVKAGYLFAGYYSMPDGQGIAYYDAMCNSVKKWDLDGGGTLYPHWVAINSVYTKSEDYVMMGEYPQTIASPQAVSAMRAAPDTDGYYRSDFDSAKYVKITANPYNSSYKFSDNQRINAQQEYYFKVEPIKWRILQEADGRIYVMSVNILDKGAFHNIANNNWEKAYLREWLNETFYAKAFSPLQMVAIVETQLTTKHTLIDFTYNTKDKIFLPSYEDMQSVEYGFEANDDPSAARAAVTTDYARAVGAWTGRRLDGNGLYWLRSGCHNTSSVRIVFADGNLYSGYYAYESTAGIRPAMYIKAN